MTTHSAREQQQPQLASQWYYTDQGNSTFNKGLILIFLLFLAVIAIVIMNQDIVFPAVQKASILIQKTATGKDPEAQGFGTFFFYGSLILLSLLSFGVLFSKYKQLKFLRKKIEIRKKLQEREGDAFRNIMPQISLKEVYVDNIDNFDEFYLQRYWLHPTTYSYWYVTKNEQRAQKKILDKLNSSKKID
jgi:hypothetical protein